MVDKKKPETKESSTETKPTPIYCREPDKHDLHESSDKDNIYKSCRKCDFVETIPRTH